MRAHALEKLRNRFTNGLAMTNEDMHNVRVHTQCLQFFDMEATRKDALLIEPVARAIHMSLRKDNLALVQWSRLDRRRKAAVMRAARKAIETYDAIQRKGLS